jgi:DNA-binding NarL/FixJ family response regulator
VVRISQFSPVWGCPFQKLVKQIDRFTKQIADFVKLTKKIWEKFRKFCPEYNLLTNPMLSVLISDDHQIAITGLMAAFNGLSNFKVIAQSSGGRETLSFLADNAVDIVITDLYMNDDDLNGIELTSEIKKRFPSVRVLMFSGEDKKSDILSQAFQAGIDGYVPKNAPLQELIVALNTLEQGKKYFNQDILMKIAHFNKNPPPSIKLGTSETKILELIAAGKTRKEIAETLYIATGTYDTHLQHLKQKLEVKSTVDLLRKAETLGLVK